MKKISTLLLIVFSLSQQLISAQDLSPAIRLKNGDHFPVKNITQGTFDKSAIASSLENGKYYVLIQFNRVPSMTEQMEMKSSGLALEEFLPGNAWMASANTEIDFKLFAGRGLISVTTFPLSQKIDHSLINDFDKALDKSHRIAITYLPSINKKEIIDRLAKMGVSVMPNKFEKDGLLFINTSSSKLVDIASIPYVTFILSQNIEDKPVNYVNRAAHSVAALNYAGPGGRNLNGQGVTVGVGDNADITSHIDFTGRLINRTPWYVDAHGTHTSGTTAGGGILDAKHRGMASRSTIVSQFYSDVVDNALIYKTDYNLNLTNNSYHSADGGCNGNGVYDALSNFADQQLKNNDNILHIFASGNDGSFTCAPYPAAYATVKSGWQSAKNVLTVGASDNYNNIISSFSSRGPLKDGRLKPEIVAGGWAVLSTTPNNTYNYNYGTSMAAPTVTGALALLTQRYKQLNGNALPKGALLKALVCNTAEDWGAAGPDYTFGFGNMNIRRAVEALEANRYFTGSVSTAGINPHSIIVPAGAAQVKIMLAWTDKEAAVNASVALVNDLDLQVTEPSLPIANHLPLILNSAAANVKDTATEGADHRNNMEQVVINNPAAGLYPITVNGFSVPAGPQEYFLTYEIIMPGITVEYPSGGETMVSGETEYFRWSASDNSNNQFTVEYSDDNGSTWSVISSTVPSTSRMYAWSVPIGLVTNQGKVRVSRNLTAYTDISENHFMILGRPSLTATQVCEGSVQLDWNVKVDATSYDVMQLDKDTMKVIANVSTNSHVVSGLDRNKDSWFSVRALNGSVAGRPSLAVKIKPNGGPCTLAIFNNNLSLDSVLAPVNGRMNISTSSNATQPIKARIRNLDDAASSGNIDVSYSINGAAAVTETIAPSISAGGTYTHTFAQHALSPGPAVYDIKVWVKKAGDVQVLNDSARRLVRHLANPALVLPYLENFDATPVSEYRDSTYGLDGLDNFDFYTSSVRGRARTFINSGIAFSGNRAMTLDQTPLSLASTTDSLLMTANLSNYNINLDLLRLDFVYRNHSQLAAPGNKVWMRGSENTQWIEAYDLFINQAGISQYKAAKGININDLLSLAVPPQNVTSSFQVKFGQEGFTSANSPAAIIDLDDGYTFDDIRLSKALNDVAVVEIVSPTLSGCGLTASNQVTIKVKNFNNAILNNISVNFTINGGPVTSENIAQLNPLETKTYTFTATADLTAFIDHSFDIWATYSFDNYRANDSINNYVVHSSPLISTYPYLENFEGSNGNWYAKGTNSSWEWGTPAKTTINKAANGTKAWVTSLTGTYKNYEASYLYSPCFNLSGLTNPVLSFSHAFKLEDDCDCDYHWAEYSTDGGLTWQKLGSVGQGTNWYTNVPRQRWQTSKTKWHVASIDVPTNGPSVKFRFVMESDAGVTAEGAAIDDIHIFEKEQVYTGPTLLNQSQALSGSSWVHFISGGKRIVSINPNGQNLGSTSVSIYMNAGPVRNKFKEYHLDRNLVVRPTIQPSSSVGVRFYFTNAEANALINATGCPLCTTIKDAYEAAILKYNSNVIEENGTFDDNYSGTYNLFSPAQVLVVPYDTGYYAEFNVTSFSELWINDGNPQFPPLPISLSTFDAVKEGRQAKLNWTTSQEINSHKFVVERSADGISFNPIGEVMAKGNSSTPSSYLFKDASPFTGPNYYRLKMFDKDNAYKLSMIRKLDFNGSNGIVVYPNPVTSGSLFIEAVNGIQQVELFDIAGKKLKSINNSGNKLTIAVEDLPAGIYQLKIYSEGKVFMEKIRKQ